MAKKPSVTAMIIVYNCEAYLKEAINSLLDQTVRPEEIIVVDDGSTDGTADIARQFLPDIRYHYQQNAGIGAARNAGIRLAKGDFYTFLDADDYWTTDKLALQKAAFEENPSLDVVFGHVKQFISPELDASETDGIYCPEQLIPGYLPGPMMIRQEAFHRVGLFETKWHLGQDVSWTMRANEIGLNALMLRDVVYYRRIHKTNQGITQRQFIKDRVRILKESLDRRRKMGLEVKKMF